MAGRIDLVYYDPNEEPKRLVVLSRCELNARANGDAKDDELQSAAAAALMSFYRVMGHKVDAPRLRNMLVCAIRNLPFLENDDTPPAPLEVGLPE